MSDLSDILEKEKKEEIKGTGSKYYSLKKTEPKIDYKVKKVQKD